MDIKIKDFEEDSWYKDYVGVEFDIEAQRNPETRYLEYKVIDTKRNRRILKDKDVSSLSPVRYKHACNCNSRVEEIGNKFIFISTTPCGFHYVHQEGVWYG